MKRGRKRGSSNIKTWEIVGYRQSSNPFKKTINKLLEVSARTQEEADKQGRNYAKMMGVEFSHSYEKSN
jgi:hypothetical protein